MAKDRPNVRVFSDLDALSRAAADELATLAAEAIAARGVFHVALSGGSTPKKLFAVLAARGRAALPWDQIQLWWGDERTVPPDHPDSNYGMARKALIEPLKLDPANVHRMVGEGADFAAHAARAAEYAQQLAAALGPDLVFDLVYLGMGPDGHCASLFPGTPALDETRATVVANQLSAANGPGPTVRITLTAPAINHARHVRFLIAGADKAAPLYEVLDGARDPKRFPSQLIAPSPGDLAWSLEAVAAARLGVTS
jgi:6-phosphogluconolactonase